MRLFIVTVIVALMAFFGPAGMSDGGGGGFAAPMPTNPQISLGEGGGTCVISYWDYLANPWVLVTKLVPC